MKKLLALLMTLAMVFSVFGSVIAESVDAANVADQPEFQVMTLGNYKYGEDYVSLYEKVYPIYWDITNHTDEVLKKTYEIFE